MASVKVKTTGMHCHSCAMLVRMSVEEVPGVESADVDVAAGMTDVSYDPAVADIEQIVAAITAAGYGASLEA